MSGRRDALSWYAAGFVAFLYAPVLLMPLFSFNDSNFARFPLAGFTTRHYAAMAANASMMEALRNSLVVAVGVAAAATLLALPAALALTRHRIPGRGALTGFLMLPLVVPAIVLGVALLVLLIRILGVELSLWTVAAGHLVVALPFSLAVLMSRLEGFDPSLEEASRDLGAGTFGTFRRVTLPLAMPGVIASLLLAFIVSFDEFVISFFLTGTQNTLPVFLFSQLRFPNRLPGTLALGSLILLGSALLVILAEVIRRRGLPAGRSGAL